MTAELRDACLHVYCSQSDPNETRPDCLAVQRHKHAQKAKVIDDPTPTEVRSPHVSPKVMAKGGAALIILFSVIAAGLFKLYEWLKEEGHLR